MSLFAIEFQVPVDHIHVSMSIANIGADGWCRRVPSLIYPGEMHREIIISKTRWDQLSFVHKRELIFHELGHCVLDLDHVKSEDIMRDKKYATKPDGSNWNKLLDRMQEQRRKSNEN